MSSPINRNQYIEGHIIIWFISTSTSKSKQGKGGGGPKPLTLNGKSAKYLFYTNIPNVPHYWICFRFEENNCLVYRHQPWYAQFEKCTFPFQCWICLPTHWKMGFLYKTDLSAKDINGMHCIECWTQITNSKLLVVCKLSAFIFQIKTILLSYFKHIWTKQTFS